MDHQYYTYILSSRRQGALYVGVTKDLIRRVYEQRKGLIEGFTRRYRVKRLVYYEAFADVWDAIQREKALKGWRRD